MAIKLYIYYITGATLFFCLITTPNILKAQSGEDYFKEANDALEKKAYKKALKSIDKAILFDDKNPDYYIKKEEISYGISQDLTDLFKYLTKAIEVKPNTSKPYNIRAFYYEKLYKFQEAILDYTKALEYADHDSLKIKTYTNRGGLYTKIRKFDLANEDFIKGYAIDSTDIYLLNNYSMCLNDMGRSDETKKYLHKIIEVDSTFTPAWVNLGFQASLEEKFEEALYFLNKADELSPDEPYTLNNRGYAKLKLGKIEDALIDINRSIELNNQNSYAYRNRALVYLDKKNKPQACEDLNKATKLGFTNFYGKEVEELIKEHCF